ncbi:hypothetical protein SAMN04488054_10667 [Salibacterium qingdaonense]|uniref:Uncharacterized protein n=1 Tax=Salibacterium qingdaonense TaxID=266892 RepID=A0A1I4KYX7_9BACI|nr:hypothetical protein SAMN04488054_10667 [Salibacterium qingdaonense]
MKKEPFDDRTHRKASFFMFHVRYSEHMQKAILRVFPLYKERSVFNYFKNKRKSTKFDAYMFLIANKHSKAVSMGFVFYIQISYVLY